MDAVVGVGTSEEANRSVVEKKPTVVFVLGGPGSGKGTQCAYIVEHFGFTHLSAGDLLRAEMKSGSANGLMIKSMINEGNIVPSEVTVKLLERAMEESEPAFVLFFDCPEEEMERRILNRNQGREDDNIETIRKRFKVFLESSLPVVEYYESIGKVQKIDAARPVEEVFESVKAAFTSINEKED